MFTGRKTPLTAAVALVGAGVIAVTPVEPASAATPPINPAVRLAAIPSPLQFYPQVLLRAAENTAALVEAYFADPLPLTRLTIEKQAHALVEAWDAIGAGDGAAALSAVGRMVFQPVVTAAGAWEYFDGLMDNPNAPGALFQIVFSPVLGGFAALGVAIDEVVDAAVALDPVGLLNAVLNIPARILDGVLNGGYGSPFGNFDNLPGLVTPLTVEGYFAPGPIALAIRIGQDAADHIEQSEAVTAQVGAEHAVAVEPSDDSGAGPHLETGGEKSEPSDDLLAKANTSETGGPAVAEDTATNVPELANSVPEPTETEPDQLDSRSHSEPEAEADSEPELESELAQDAGPAPAVSAARPDPGPETASTSAA
ncbi:hypothetical protein [Mycobacterium sp. ZZG]